MLPAPTRQGRGSHLVSTSRTNVVTGAPPGVAAATYLEVYSTFNIHMKTPGCLHGEKCHVINPPFCTGTTSACPRINHSNLHVHTTTLLPLPINISISVRIPAIYSREYERHTLSSSPDNEFIIVRRIMTEKSTISFGLFSTVTHITRERGL